MADTLKPTLPSSVQRVLDVVHIDWAPPQRQPKAVRWVVAAVLSLVGSLACDYALAKICIAALPATKTFPHFHFSDYGKLTVIGVVIACIAWPITTRITSTPRRVFFRMAIVVTFVLWIPDLWIWAHGEPGDAVGFLMLMHLAIAVVTYNALVHLAPAGSRGGTPAGGRRGKGAGQLTAESMDPTAERT